MGAGERAGDDVAKYPWLNKRVEVAFLFDDVQVFKEGVVVDYDEKYDRYLVRTDWGDDWFEGFELKVPSVAR
jgi:hypothetical protein